jgi:hypothetical protein
MAAMACCFVLMPRSKAFFKLDHECVNDWYQKEYPAGFETPYSEIHGTAIWLI